MSVPLKKNTAFRRLLQASQDLAQRGFPAAGFAHQTQSLPGTDGQGNIVYGLKAELGVAGEHPALGDKGFCDMLTGKQWSGHSGLPFKDCSDRYDLLPGAPPERTGRRRAVLYRSGAGTNSPG